MLRIALIIRQLTQLILLMLDIAYFFQFIRNVNIIDLDFHHTNQSYQPALDRSRAWRDMDLRNPTSGVCHYIWYFQKQEKRHIAFQTLECRNPLIQHLVL